MNAGASLARVERKFAGVDLTRLDADGMFTGYASLFDKVDLGRDEMMRGAFTCQPGSDNAASIRIPARCRRRVDRHDNARHLTVKSPGRRFDPVALPQGILAILDQFAVQLLPSQPRAGITRLDRGQKTRCQIGRIVGGRHARHMHRRVRHQPFDQRHRSRRCRPQLQRLLPQPQAKLQHVKRRLHLAPFGDLVTPGGVKLRPAQTIRVFG